MFNENNCIEITLDEKVPSMKVQKLADNGSFACRRPVGAGYYDEKVNKTFVTWNGAGMDVYVREYDHNTNAYGEEIKVYENNMTGTWDYHNYANMIQAPNGTPLIFYAMHSNEMYQLTSNNKHSLSEGWSRKTISTDYNCYPAPVVVGDVIYLFYSRNDEVSYPYRTFCYIKSKDNGETWSEPFRIIDSGKNDPLKFDEVYLCGSVYVPACGGYPERIQLTWSMWGGPKGHAGQGMGAYFAYFCPSDGHIYSAGWEDLGECLLFNDMINKCCLDRTEPFGDASHTIGSIVSSYQSENGHPVVVYGYDICEKSVRSAVWTGEAWKRGIAEQDCFGIKDIYKDKNGEITIACCKGCYILIKKLNEKGTEWELVSATKIPFENEANSVPYLNFIENHGSEVQLILGEMDLENCFKDYSGKWPVYIIGE